MSGLNFLSKVGVTASMSADALNLSAEEIEAETSELHQEELTIAKMRNEIGSALNSMDHVMSAADVAIGLKANAVENKLVSAVFAQHLAVAGVPEDVAEEASVGAESAGEEIGNEALQKAKDIIMDIVAWLVDKWKELKALVKRTFAKRFGSIKRSTEAWRRLKARVEAFEEEGRTLDDKAKLEIKKGAAYFVVGAPGQENPKTPENWKSLAKLVEESESLATDLSDSLRKDMVSDASSISELKGTPADITDSFSKMPSFNTGSDAVNQYGLGLLGRNAVVVQLRHAAGNAPKISYGTMTEEQLRETRKVINGITVGIRPSNVKLKSIDEVKLDVPSLDQINALADAHIQVGTSALTLETDKNLVKIEKAFDKALANAKKWAKDTENDSAEAKRKAVAGANLMSALLMYHQDATIGMVSQVLSQISATSKAHGAAASQALGRYKKA